jgi:type II secretory ATPase GspE/PulE/Tfp pilus assembly ATPase PilB-like protein
MPAATLQYASLANELQALRSGDADYATRFVDCLLRAAANSGVSDIHLQPTDGGLWLRWRVDGVLRDVGTFPRGTSSDVVTRLKVLANLLTYRTDVAQEGRLEQRVAGGSASNNASLEMRVSTFPTLYGERAVVRLFANASQLSNLADLGLPDDILATLEHLLAESSGAILVTGPAGCGKTTTCYAMLRHLVAAAGGGRSIVSIEDPVEVAVAGVAQAQVNLVSGFDLASGLKGLLRQDPEVLMVSEIRDAETAALALGASLTGHLVIGSFHAASSASAISRLADMGIEPYVLRSGVLGILSQRLVRQLCACSREIRLEEEKLGLDIRRARAPVGCDACQQSGYQGRMLIAELLTPGEGSLARAILSRDDAPQLEQLAVQNGMITRWQRASKAVEWGHTSPAEVRRVLGFSRGQS